MALAKWSQVENVMQRRYDLIPNLEASVKGSMKHETKVFGAIADARTQYAGAKSDTEKLEANDEMNKASNMLINVVHESYPELASNENVKTLMTQLEGTEKYNKKTVNTGNKSFDDTCDTKIKPGVYKCTYYGRSHAVHEQVYTKMEWIRDI